MTVNQELIRAAADQADRRWPDRDAVGAAVRLKDGSVLTGVPFSNFNAVMVLCAETGPICVAYTNGQTIIASVCVNRDYASGEVTVIAPCGGCQERLVLWGPEVQVGVPDPTSAVGWSSRSLVDVNPYYWAASQTPDLSWPKPADHEWMQDV